MPSYGDIYQVKVSQTMFGVNCLNVFFYQVVFFGTDVAEPADGLRTMFYTQVWQNISLIQSEHCIMNRIEVLNLSDLFDLSSNEYIDPGQQTGEAMPQFVAWKYVQERAAAGQRNGYKRFAGVAESSVVNGLPSAGISSLLVAVNGALSTTVTDVGRGQWLPVIVAHPIVYGVNPTVRVYADDWSYDKIVSQASRRTL